MYLDKHLIYFEKKGVSKMSFFDNLFNKNINA